MMATKIKAVIGRNFFSTSIPTITIAGERTTVTLMVNNNYYYHAVKSPHCANSYNRNGTFQKCCSCFSTNSRRCSDGRSATTGAASAGRNRNPWLNHKSTDTYTNYSRNRHSDINRSTGAIFFIVSSLAATSSIFIMGSS